jgi:hypothetical protein
MSILKSLLAVVRTDDSNLGLRRAQFLNHRHISAVLCKQTFNRTQDTTQTPRQSVLQIRPMVSIWIQIQRFASMRIQIRIRMQGAKLMRTGIRADPFAVTKVGF